MTFRIAAYIEGPNPLYWFTVEELISLADVPSDPDASYQDHSETVPTLGGGSFGRGFPVARWHFDVLTAHGWNAFRDVCPGTSARVYIETITNEVEENGDPVWIQAGAVMNWPTGEPDRQADGSTLDVDFEFTQLVEVS